MNLLLVLLAALHPKAVQKEQTCPFFKGQNSTTPPPVFDRRQYNFTVAVRDTLSVGEVRASVTWDSELRYFLVGTDEFNVNTLSGHIKQKRPLSRDRPKSYTFFAVATDEHYKSATAKITVNIAVPLFHDRVSKGNVPNPIVEASGLAASRQHPGILYTHNDKGGVNRIYAIDANTAAIVATLTISGAANEDWEDIAVGNCGNSSKYCMYIGDVGDGGPSPQTIYRVEEPATMVTQTLMIDSTLLYTWGEDDCETLMVDPAGELYIVSKTDDEASVLARLPSSNWGTGESVAVAASARLPKDLYTTKKNPVGGDISPNGTEMLIKFKEYVMYYRLGSGETYEQAISRYPDAYLPYIQEPRGETVCWSRDADGYYTTSEQEDEGPQPLYFYERFV